MNKSKLKNILANLASADDKTLEGFQAFDDGVAKLKADLKEKIQINTLDEVNSKLKQFQSKINLEPLQASIDQLSTEFTQQIESLSTQLEDRVAELVQTAEDKEVENEQGKSVLNDDITNIRTAITDLVNEQSKKLDALQKQLLESDQASDSATDSKIAGLDLKIIEVDKKVVLNKDETDASLLEKDANLTKLRTELVSMIASKGGGNQNRQILVSGVDPLTRYTDINFKAGAGTTITYANNDTTKKVEVTITATGSGLGITRSIISISAPTTAGSTSGIDYVYLVSGTITITLPTAVGNTNLYTVKNVGTGVVTIATTSAQTIDSSSTIVMPVQYTSVDLISDTANWNIT